MTYNPRYFSNTQVTTPQITESAVTEDKIATDAVTTSKIKNATIKTEDIADKAVTLAKLGDDVPAVGIPDDSISAAKLADDSVEKRHIKTASVDTDELANASVTTDKIRDANVTGVKIAANAITTGKIATGAVGTSDIANGAVTPEKLSFSVPSRPLTPPIATAEIGDGQVTQAKLAPDVQTGDRFVWGAEGQTGNPRSSADVLYLTDISSDIPYTVFDLSPWVPANAKGVILQLGIFNQAFAQGRAFFRVRTNETQRDALGLGMMVGSNSMVANAGIVPLVVGTPSVEYALESVGGPWVATLTLYVTVVGYIV
ncbi:MAG TPA: hypothetical protein VJC37_06160 [Planctomycetota bacterium]|nr:hypothetical protein [Planctomycetota bacterium]